MNNYYKKYFIFNIVRDKIHVKGAVMNFFWKPKQIHFCFESFKGVIKKLSLVFINLDFCDCSLTIVMCKK